MKDKMQKFIDFLNSEEITALKKSMDIDWVREEMKKASPFLPRKNNRHYPSELKTEAVLSYLRSTTCT